MTMRVILLVRGSLAAGGSFHGSSAPNTTGQQSGSMSGGGVGVGAGSTGNRSAPFHITASGPGPAVRGMRTSKDLSSSSPAHGTGTGTGTGAGVVSRASNVGNNGGAGVGGMNNKMSQPTFAVPRPGDDLEYEPSYGDMDAGVDVKAGDVADEVDVWERNKEDAPRKRTEAWEQ